MNIFRYNIDVHGGQQIVKMPLGYKILSMAPGRAGYNIDVWALVDEFNKEVPVVFRVFGTGHGVLPAEWGERTFVGTAVMSDGLVWHVFTGGEYVPV